MRQPSPLLIIFISLITILAVLINLPNSINLPIKIWGVNNIRLINLNTFLAAFDIKRDFSLKKGLDLEGGTSITLKADMSEIPSAERNNALDSAREVIERRINFFGVSEPIIQTSRSGNDYRIIVEIPGITDVNQAVQLIGTTAQLTFWEEGASPSAELATDSAALLPFGVAQILGPNAKKTDLTGKDLQKAVVTFNPNTGVPQVQLTFTPEGSKKFAEITKRNVGKIVGIVLDNQLIQAPRVSEPIFGGRAEITGQFTTEQAKNLQIQLNAGALPVPLSVLEQRSIGASLGNVSLQKSFIAGLIGFLVIVVFMIALYGQLGVVASMALTVYTLITLAIFRLIPVTLTLAGIAGFILSIGIAVDANILIFERMREEMRKGKSNYVALDLGFSRAWASIRDSNIASLITSAILMIFGTGIVRGFALTLAIGVLVSLFSAITLTRTLLRIIFR
ncbi:MAG: protein translocase subunit SecD [Patescibacteria group bacterium]|nr:MAG: protein translocase subunit SecD [Patescibacteria group bacterium]